MISNTKQTWEIGSRVKVGFLTLTVHSIYQNADRYLPNTYLMISDKGKPYEFVPHNGLRAI